MEKKKHFLEAEESMMTMAAEEHPFSILQPRKPRFPRNIPMETWEMHFSSVFRTKETRPAFKLEPCDMDKSELFTAEDIMTTNKELIDREACRPDSIYNEHLEGSAEALKDVWTQLLNLCVITQSIPNRWRKSTVRVLYKGKGGAEDPNAYRGIALDCAKLLTKRLTSLINCSILEEQFGFRRGRSTLQAIKCLQRDVEDAPTQQTGKPYLLTIVKPSIP